MAARRSRRSGTGAFDAVPDRLVSGPDRLRTRPARSALIAVFVVFSLLDAFWLCAFFGTLIFDPSDIDGMSDVVVFLVGQTILTGILLPTYRGVRRTKPGPRRPPARRLIRRAIRPAPHGRHTLATNPTGPRTALSPRQIDATSWLTRSDRQTVDLPEDGTLVRLAEAEQALGNALYELDLCRGRHSLTRERISAMRVTGLQASAWLTTQADRDAVPWRGRRRAAKRLQDGVRHYAELASQAEDFLAGRASAAQLGHAHEALARDALWRIPDATG